MIFGQPKKTRTKPLESGNLLIFLGVFSEIFVQEKGIYGNLITYGNFPIKLFLRFSCDDDLKGIWSTYGSLVSRFLGEVVEEEVNSQGIFMQVWQTHPSATFTKIAPGESVDFLPLQPLNPNRSGMPIWEAVVAGSCHGRDFWVDFWLKQFQNAAPKRNKWCVVICDIGGAKEPGMMYLPTKWGAVQNPRTCYHFFH